MIFDFVKSINRTIVNSENLAVDFYKDAKEFLSKTAVNVLGIMDFEPAMNSENNSFENGLNQLLIRLKQQAKTNINRLSASRSNLFYVFIH